MAYLSTIQRRHARQLNLSNFIGSACTGTQSRVFFTLRGITYSRSRSIALSTNFNELKPNVRDIFTSSAHFFADKGMAAFRMMPALFQEADNEKASVATHGRLFCLFYPKAAEDSEKRYDKMKKIIISFDAFAILKLMNLNLSQLQDPIVFEGAGGHLEFSKTGDEDKNLRIRAISTKRTEELMPVETTLRTGQFAIVQVMLEKLYPTLFGWQVLVNPSLLSQFLDPIACAKLQAQKEALKLSDEKKIFFD